MKICIPTAGNKGLDEPVNEHFGSAPFFTVVDLESKAVEIIDNENQHHTHGQCQPMRQLLGKGIAAVVCGGMGCRAVELLNADGVKVYLGTGGKVKELIAEYQNGNLKELTAEGACAGHGCH